jgi:hypothetical protein
MPIRKKAGLALPSGLHDGISKQETKAGSILLRLGGRETGGSIMKWVTCYYRVVACAGDRVLATSNTVAISPPTP